MAIFCQISAIGTNTYFPSKLENHIVNILQSHAQVKFWIDEFKQDKAFIEHHSTPGCPLVANDDGMYCAVRILVYWDISHGSDFIIERP